MCFFALTACIDKGEDHLIRYDTAECIYFGNKNDTETGMFMLFLSASEQNFICIQGYATLSSFSDFELDEGKWNPGTGESFGKAKTFVFGSLSGSTIQGSVYSDDVRTVLINGGSFDVAISGNSYTITTNFSGKIPNTNISIDNIRSRFHGTIDFFDESDDD